jgi:hypothetical protein
MKVAKLASLILVLWGVSACSAMGPKANVSVIKAEVKKTKEVQNIIVANTTGIDNSGNLGKAILGTALKAYGDRSRPFAAIKPIVSSVGAPDGVADVLTVAYEAEFAKYVEKYANKKKRPNTLKLPSSKLGFKVPKGMKGAKQLAAKMKAEAKSFQVLATAMSSNDTKKLTKALDEAKTAVQLEQKFNEFLFVKLDATYILLTHVKGGEAEYKAGKKVKFSAALVNVKTGNLRYFAHTEGGKGDIPVPFIAWAPNVMSNIFDAVEEKDPLPAMPEEKETASL